MLKNQKIIVAAVLGLGLWLWPGQQSTDAKNQDQVTICHIPPGNPANAHTITVGMSAVQTHLNQHGDYLGECTASADDCDACEYSDSDYSSESSCVASCGLLFR